MSAPITHTFTALVVLLVAALAHVHALELPMKSINSNRPRLREDYRKEQRDSYKYHRSHEEGLHETQHKPELKYEVTDKYEKYEDTISKEDKLFNSAAELYSSETAPDADQVQEEKVSKNYHKLKSSPSHLDRQSDSDNSAVHSDRSSTPIDFPTEDSDFETTSDFNETDVGSLSLLEENDNSSLSNDSFIDHSSSDSKNSTKDGQCSTCRMRDDARNNRIENLKLQILSMLKIRNLPNTTGVPIPKVPALAHLYEMDGDMMSDSPYGKRNNGYNSHYHDPDYDEDFVVKTERAFTVARQAPIGIQLNITNTVYFSLPVVLYTSKIKTAYLWFYIRKQDVQRPYLTLTVERILPEPHHGNKIITKLVFSQKLLRDKAFGWKRIDMRDTLRRWTKHPMTNRGLLIRVDDDYGNNLIVLPPSPDIDKGYEPWLDTKVVEPRSNSRHRRSDALVCTDNSTETRCCRYPLFVAFAQFGWDWIIAPTHVKADFCAGECRMTLQDNTPYSWVNQQLPRTGGTCCTPTKMSPLPLLYFDEDQNIIYQILQDMKVDKCGCA